MRWWAKVERREESQGLNSSAVGWKWLIPSHEKSSCQASGSGTWMSEIFPPGLCEQVAKTMKLLYIISTT